MTEVDHTPNFQQFPLDEGNNFSVNNTDNEPDFALNLNQSFGLDPSSHSELEPEPFQPEATQENQWVASTYEVHQQNHELLNRNSELQTALDNTKADLEQTKFQLQQAEELNAQQSDELNAAYEQNLTLSQQLQEARHEIQHQQETIDNLTEKLKISQQRVAQLERECALIQKQFQEQSYKRSQAEKQCQDLSFRLQKQRHYTWQFKTALKTYLNNHYEAEDGGVIKVDSNKSEPIPAWSTQQQLSLTTDNRESTSSEQDIAIEGELTPTFSEQETEQELGDRSMDQIESPDEQQSPESIPEVNPQEHELSEPAMEMSHQINEERGFANELTNKPNQENDPIIENMESETKSLEDDISISDLSNTSIDENCEANDSEPSVNEDIETPPSETAWDEDSETNKLEAIPAPIIGANQNRKKRKSYSSVKLPNFF